MLKFFDMQARNPPLEKIRGLDLTLQRCVHLPVYYELFECFFLIESQSIEYVFAYEFVRALVPKLMFIQPVLPGKA